MFANAKQAEIIRSNQKDEYYAGYIKSHLTDVVQTFFGPRAWMKWKKELYLGADLGYFALTTMAGFQTLGEEYVTIVQADNTLRRIPSRLTRLAMVMLQVLAPYAIDKSLQWLEKEFQQNMQLNVDTQTRARVLETIPVLRNIVTVFHRCHLALFYMKGAFYHISKRLTGINYILVRDVNQGESGSNYRILGWLSIIQLAITLLYQGYKLLRARYIAQHKKLTGQSRDEDVQTYSKSTRDSTETSEELAEPDPSRKCALCLEARKQSTATPCGHLFCWSCITEWCQSKTECPLCREEFEMSRLIFLKNYDPV